MPTCVVPLVELDDVVRFARIEQELQAVDEVGAAGGQVQRRVAVDVGQVGLGAAVQKQRHGLGLILQYGQVQRRLLAVVLRVDQVGAVAVARRRLQHGAHHVHLVVQQRVV